MPPPTLREFVLHSVVDPDGRVPAVLFTVTTYLVALAVFATAGAFRAPRPE